MKAMQIHSLALWLDPVQCYKLFTGKLPYIQTHDYLNERGWKEGSVVNGFT